MHSYIEWFCRHSFTRYITVHTRYGKLLVCFSDHHLLTCRLGVPPTPPIMATYSYRELRRIDTAAFSRDILSSRLYDGTTMDADEYDEYAELFDEEVGRVSNHK